MSFGTLMDDEIRVGKDIQSRLQQAMDQVLGKRKASVLVDVQLDLAPYLKKKLEETWKEGAGQPSKAANKAEAPSAIPWPSLDRAGSVGGGEIPTDLFAGKRAKMAGTVQSVSPFMDPHFLLSAGLEIKRISVKVLLDQTLPLSAEEAAKKVVGDFIPLETQRGDSLIIDRVSMPTAWSETLGDPSVFAMVMQKAPVAVVLLLLGLFFLFICLVGFAVIRTSVNRVAGALESLGTATTAHRVSVTENQTAQISADQTVGDKGLLEMGEKREQAAPGLLKIGLHQVEQLHQLLSGEPVENVALVVPALPEDVRTAYLSMQSPERTASILSLVSQVTLVEPELMARLKEELEKRLSGSVGGIETTVRILESSPGAAARRYIEGLRSKDPQLAERVRARVLLFEDLAHFPDSDLAMILSNVKINVLAAAMAELKNGFLDKVKSSLTDLRRSAVQESLAAKKPTPAEVDSAQDQVMAVTRQLIKGGRISPPPSKTIEGRLLGHA